MKNTVFMVGDKFSNFGALDGAMTVSRLISLFDGDAPEQELPARIIVGQGVSEGWLNYLKRRAEARDFPVEFVENKPISMRTGRRFSHKWQRNNVLITDPDIIGPNHYRMVLSIDDDCEIMSDHTTGYHIQGMVLTEAARQAFLAVTEWFLLPSDAKYYFVINTFNVSYMRFAFPVHIDVDLLLSEIDRSRDDRLAAKVLIRFRQQGETVCEAEIEYTAILEQRLSGKEKQMAEMALQQALVQPDVALTA